MGKSFFYKVMERSGNLYHAIFSVSEKSGTFIFRFLQCVIKTFCVKKAILFFYLIDLRPELSSCIVSNNCFTCTTREESGFLHVFI